MKVLDGIIDVECDLAMEHISKKDFSFLGTVLELLFLFPLFFLLRWLYKNIDRQLCQSGLIHTQRVQFLQKLTNVSRGL